MKDCRDCRYFVRTNSLGGLCYAPLPAWIGKQAEKEGPHYIKHEIGESCKAHEKLSVRKPEAQ